MSKQEKYHWKQKAEMSSEANKSETTGSEQQEITESRRQSPFLATAAMIKLASLQRKKKSSASSAKNSKDDSYLEGPFGIGSLIIPALQRLNNIRFFMVLYCILVLCQGTVFGLADLSTAIFEKQYFLKKSSKVALSATYDTTSCLAAVFIGYYGGRGNRPRWIAGAAILVGVGALLFAAPYTYSETLPEQKEVEEMCQETEEIRGCPKSKLSFQDKYVHFFIFGQILEGIAGMPIYILGVTFLDDSVPTHSSGIYLGLGEASQILGYGLGYSLGAPLQMMTKSKTDSHSPTSHGATDTDTEIKKRTFSVGWLVSFLTVATITWCTGIPFVCFPHSLPGTYKIKSAKDKHPQWHGIKLKNMEFGAHIKDLISAIQILIKNPMLITQTFSKASESLAFIGTLEFLPIYLENQFLLTRSQATILTGVLLIPGCAIGHFLGGFIVCMLEMSCKTLMRFTIVASTVSVIFLSMVIFVHCETSQFAGINENYDSSGILGNLTAPCNAPCRCSTNIYSSVCGRDEVEYFSPCYAGCKTVKHLKEITTYYNCSCIKQGLATTDEEGDFIDAVPGKCNTKCYKLPLFFAFMLCSIFYSSLCSIPINLTILRTVPQKLSSLALGMTYVTLRLFGTIPGPLIFKMMAETACTFWDINKCGYKGNCWSYSKTKMVYILVGMCFFCKACTIFFTAIGLYIYKTHTQENMDNMPLLVKGIKASQE